MKEAGKIDPKAVENTTLRLGLQSKLAEKVEDAKEDPSCLKQAKADRFDATGEPSEAPMA